MRWYCKLLVWFWTLEPLASWWAFYELYMT